MRPERAPSRPACTVVERAGVGGERGPLRRHPVAQLGRAARRRRTANRELSARARGADGREPLAHRARPARTARARRPRRARRAPPRRRAARARPRRGTRRADARLLDHRVDAAGGVAHLRELLRGARASSSSYPLDDGAVLAELVGELLAGPRGPRRSRRGAARARPRCRRWRRRRARRRKPEPERGRRSASSTRPRIRASRSSTAAACGAAGRSGPRGRARACAGARRARRARLRRERRARRRPRAARDVGALGPRRGVLDRLRLGVAALERGERVEPAAALRGARRARRRGRARPSRPRRASSSASHELERDRDLLRSSSPTSRRSAGGRSRRRTPCRWRPMSSLK